jgi:hypothetical protein
VAGPTRATGFTEERHTQTSGGVTAWLRQLRGRWAALTQAAAIVLGTIGTVVLPPPMSIGGEPPWRRLAQFVAAVLLALMFVSARRTRGRGAGLWWWIAAASLVLAVLAAFGYDHLTGAWSCRYDDVRMVIGDEFTPQAREHFRQDSSATCERMIADFAGQVDDVWLPDGIRRRQSILAAAYVGAVALFTICIVAAVEAVARVERPGRPTPSRRRPRMSA